jgi:hypothetical protein
LDALRINGGAWLETVITGAGAGYLFLDGILLRVWRGSSPRRHGGGAAADLDHRLACSKGTKAEGRPVHTGMLHGEFVSGRGFFRIRAEIHRPGVD